MKEVVLDTETTGLSVKDGHRIVEIGEGAQVAYLKAGLPWNKKMKIFVTHLHIVYQCQA